MITNTGKTILAKYLIGDAPAYASYIALGCGPKPRKQTSQYTDVSLFAISGGSITHTSPTATIIDLENTDILLTGMTITKQVDSGSGTIIANPTILDITSPYSIVISSSTSLSDGTLSFYTSGTASVLSLDSQSDINELWVGAKVTFEGTSISHTAKIVSINPDTSFTIVPGIPNVSTFLTNQSTVTMTVDVDEEKEELDFEMFRIPISSRGYANDNGVSKVIFTSQLPTEERYEISEVGIYSAGSNAAAGQYDSKTITAFSGDENWQLYVASEESLFGSGSTFFPEYTVSLIDGNNDIQSSAIAIKTDSANGLFTNVDRSNRYERPRYLKNVLLLKSDSSQIFATSSNKNSLLEIPTSFPPSYLQLNGISIDLSKNSPTDLIKLAFSLIAINGEETNIPDTTRVIIEFIDRLGNVFAQLQSNISNYEYNFSNNRYVVEKSRLDDLIYLSESTSSWQNVSAIKIYTSAVNRKKVTNLVVSSDVVTLTLSDVTGIAAGDAIKVFNVDSTVNGVATVVDVISNTITFSKDIANITSTGIPNGHIEVINKDFYIALDAIRIDNVTTQNPLYGLTGYSVIQNDLGTVITKSPNTNNYVEYRFALDVT